MPKSILRSTLRQLSVTLFQRSSSKHLYCLLFSSRKRLRNYGLFHALCLHISYNDQVIKNDFNNYIVFSKQMKSLGQAVNMATMGSSYLITMATYLQFIFIFNSFGFTSNVADSFIAKTSETLTGSIFSFFSLDCLLQYNGHAPTIYLKALVNTLLPLLIMSIFAVKIFVCNRNKKLKKLKLTEVLISLILTLFMLQPNIIQSVLDIFSCVELSVDHSYITKDLSVQCFSIEHINWVLGLGIPSFLIYAVIIPAIFCSYVFVKRKQLSDKEFATKVGFLIHGYTKQKFYWEYIVLWKKIVIIFCSIFVKNIHTKVCLTIIILVILSYFQEKEHPYLTKNLNIFELNSNKILILILLLKMISYDNENPGAYYICMIIVIFLEVLFPIACIIKFLVVTIFNSPKLKKITEGHSGRKSTLVSSYRKSMVTEFKEFELNLGKTFVTKENAKQTQIFTETKDPLQYVDNNELILKLISIENKKLKEKISELQKENEYLKKKNSELINLNVNLISNRKFGTNENFSVARGDDPLMMDRMEESEVKCEEFKWNYSKKAIKCPLGDVQIVCNTEAFTVEDESFVESKSIKKIKFELQNISKFDLNSLEIKWGISESKFLLVS